MLHLYFLSSVFGRSVVLLDPGGRPFALRHPPLGHFSCSNLQRLPEIPGAESGVARFDSHGRFALIRSLKRRRDPLATVQKCVATFGRCQLPLKSALALRILLENLDVFLKPPLKTTCWTFQSHHCGGISWFELGKFAFEPLFTHHPPEAGNTDS